MIVTLTANPSVDRTVTLAEPLRRGGVQRALGATVQAGGKGVNVSRVVALAGTATVAVLPGSEGDPVSRDLAAAGIDHRVVPGGGPIRTNVAITEIDGTTTKINEPGAPLDEERRRALTELLVELSATANWIVLSGSLPPGVPADWYVELVRRLRGPRIAVDTSDAPLVTLARRFDVAAPALIKPNSEELAQLTGADPERLHDPVEAVRAAARLVDRGVGAVLATLGAAGAVLVTGDGAWHATAPDVTPCSTVGAGDSALAGYLLADLDGAAPADRLRRAVAYGTAAVTLPGTGLPGPDHVQIDAVTVTALDSLPHP